MAITNNMIIGPGYTTTPLNTTRSSRLIYAYTDSHERRVAANVYSMWSDQAKRLITGDVVRKIMTTRQVPLSVIAALEASIDKWIVDDLGPQWEGAMALGSSIMIKAAERYLGRDLGTPPKGNVILQPLLSESDFVAIGKKILFVPPSVKGLVDDYYAGTWDPIFAVDFPETAEGLTAWIRTRGAVEAIRYKEAQLATWQNVIHRGIVEQGINGVDLAAQLERSVGLTEKMEATVERHRAALIADGVSKSSARTSATRYAKTLRKRRAITIGRTELANAYNGARHTTVVDFVDRGVIHEQLVKRWYTAIDERVCDICADLHDSVISLTDKWVRVNDVTHEEREFGLHPPAHANCRCIAIYEAVVRKVAHYLGFRH